MLEAAMVKPPGIYIVKSVFQFLFSTSKNLNHVLISNLKTPFCKQLKVFVSLAEIGKAGKKKTGPNSFLGRENRQ